MRAEGLGSGNVRITVAGARIRPLKLESSAALDAANWGLVANLAAGAENSVWEIQEAGVSRYFRVR